MLSYCFYNIVIIASNLLKYYNYNVTSIVSTTLTAVVDAPSVVILMTSPGDIVLLSDGTIVYTFPPADATCVIVKLFVITELLPAVTVSVASATVMLPSITPYIFEIVPDFGATTYALDAADILFNTVVKT